VLALPFLKETELTGAGDGQYDADTGGGASSIFVLNLRPSDGVFGIQNGGMDTEYFKQTEDKVGEKVRLIWDCGIATYPKWRGGGWTCDGFTSCGPAAWRMRWR